MAVALWAREPRLTLTVPLDWLTVPWLLLADTYVTPVGSVSAIDTPVASDGPLLLAVKV